MTDNSNNTQHSEYTLPKVWRWEDIQKDDNGGKFNSTNRPVSGATHEQVLPVGDAPLQLYSLDTPNGVKVNILLEELAEAGVSDAKYDAFKINIMDGDQFGSDFVEINPNSKIPALVDHSSDTPVKLFESGAILMYLAEKFDKFIPNNSTQQKAACLSWVMWQMGSAPYLGGGFGHFYAYAPFAMAYPINRFTMEAKRQLDVLDKHLADNQYMCGDDYSIADMMIWPWYGRLLLNEVYEAAEFLQADSYTHAMRWAKQVAARPAVKRAVSLELAPIKDDNSSV